MTEEELKNKCKERAKIFQQAMESCKSSSLMDCIEWFADRIAELESKIKHLTKHLEPQAMSALFEQVEEEVKQEQRIEELEAQIGKMKCCSNCIYQGECSLSGYEECKNFDKWELRR